MVLEYLHVARMIIQRYRHVGCFRPLGDDAVIRTTIGCGHLCIHWVYAKCVDLLFSLSDILGTVELKCNFLQVH
jgi:hypothetical protein